MVNQEIKENRLKNKKGWHLGNKLYYIWEHNQKELLTFLSKYSVNIYINTYLVLDIKSDVK